MKADWGTLGGGGREVTPHRTCSVGSKQAGESRNSVLGNRSGLEDDRQVNRSRNVSLGRSRDGVWRRSEDEHLKGQEN